MRGTIQVTAPPILSGPTPVVTVDIRKRGSNVDERTAVPGPRQILVLRLCLTTFTVNEEFFGGIIQVSDGTFLGTGSGSEEKRGNDILQMFLLMLLTYFP